MLVLDHALPQAPQVLRDGREVLLRRATPADAAGLHRLQREIVEAGEGVVLSPDELPERPRPWSGEPDDLTLLALSGERVVGEASVRRIHRRALRHNAVFTLGVAPDHQGVGLGRVLSERCLCWADDNELLRVDLQVLASNTRAQALYRSLGFVDVRRQEGFLRWPDGRVEADLTMERRSPPPPERLPEGPEHAAFLEALLLSARPELAQLPPPLARMQLSAQARHYAQAWPDAESWILMHEGEPVGRLITSPDGAHLRAIDLAITPERRGQGLGGAALRAMQRACAARSQELSLSVMLHNPARRLYERLGFQEVRTEGLHVEMRWSPPPPVISD